MNTSTKVFIVTVLGMQLFPPVHLLADSSADHIKRGDAFIKAFDNQRALDEYLSAFRADSSGCEALWKICDAYVNLGEDADKSLRSQYYYVAEKWAGKAVQSCPASANAHFFKAVTSGLLAIFEGGRDKVRRSREVKEEAERALELDPNHHGALHTLGRWHQEIADLSWLLKAVAKVVYGGVPPGATFEESVANFKRAIEISPGWINHHRQLGVTYVKMKEWGLARQAFETAMELPIQDHQDAHHKMRCQELLEKISGKK